MNENLVKVADDALGRVRQLEVELSDVIEEAGRFACETADLRERLRRINCMALWGNGEVHSPPGMVDASPLEPGVPDTEPSGTQLAVLISECRDAICMGNRDTLRDHAMGRVRQLELFRTLLRVCEEIELLEGKGYITDEDCGHSKAMEDIDAAVNRAIKDGGE